MSVDYVHREEDVKLPLGDWVLRGSTRVFVPAEKWNRNEIRSAYIFDVIARNLAATQPEPVVLATLCHCGCLLIDAAEPCPACLVWAIDDAIEWSWRASETRYQPAVRYQQKEAA